MGLGTAARSGGRTGFSREGVGVGLGKRREARGRRAIKRVSEREKSMAPLWAEVAPDLCEEVRGPLSDSRAV
jgi:hypothetical protein